MVRDEVDHEVVVSRGRDVYTVDAVERTIPFIGSGPTDLGAYLVELVLAVAWGRLVVAPTTRLKLGVMWRPVDGDDPPPGRVIYKERLDSGTDAAEAVARVVREVEAGGFDRVRPQWFRPTTYRRSTQWRAQPG